MQASSKHDQRLYADTIAGYVARTVERPQALDVLAKLGFDETSAAKLLLDADTNTIRSLQVQNETHVRIAQVRERNLRQACQERDRFRLMLAALEVDDRLEKLVAALLKHALQDVCRASKADGSPMVTGQRCKECEAEVDYRLSTAIAHQPGCIIDGCFDA